MPHLRGHWLFDENANYNALSHQLATGATIKTTRLSEQFDYDAFQAYYQYSALPLFVITSSGDLLVWTADQPLAPTPGQRIVSLTPAEILATVASETMSDNA